MNDGAANKGSTSGDIGAHAFQLMLAGIAVAVMQRDMTWRPALTEKYFPQYFSGQMHTLFNARLMMRAIVNAISGIAGLEVLDVNYVLQIFFAVGGMIATWFFARRWLSGNGALACALLAAAWLLWGFSFLGWNISYPYDLPAFAFSALGLAAIVHRRYGLVVACVVIGGLNKETVFWLIPAWFFHSAGDGEPRFSRASWVRSAVLAMAFLAVYVLPRYFLKDAVTDSIITMSFVDRTPETGLSAGMRILQNLQRLIEFKPIYFPGDLHLVLSIHILPLLFWNQLPIEMRRIFLAVPFFVIPTILAGNIWEVRIFAELLPLSCTAWILGWSRFLKADDGR